MKALIPLMLCGCVVLIDGPASSEDEPKVDCAKAVTQMEMNICAARNLADADEALNRQWQETKKATAVWDDLIEDEGRERGAEARLLKAQRAWLSYRDTQCDSLGFSVEGGSMKPIVVSDCLADLTRKRTEELGQISDSLVN